jgi:hypothetical protein
MKFSIMKVFLRNTETGLFYAGPDHWTGEHGEAMEFRGPDRALDQVSEAKLNAMEVIIHFEESHFDIPLKIVGLGA